MREYSEVARQLVHILSGACALLLGWLTWWQAATFALGAVLFNVFVLPRIGRLLYRPADLAAPLRSGIVIYPLAVLALVLCFPRRPDIAAAAWAILAFGDGCATLVGAHVGTSQLAWNRAKSAGGLLAFVVVGATASVAMTWAVAHGTTPVWWVIAAPITATLVAAFVETTPIRLDDNISVPAMSALVLWSLSFVDASALQAAARGLADRTPLALAFNGAVAGAGWWAGTVTRGGAITGAAIGVVVLLGAGWAGWAMLFASFAVATAATRLGLRRKMLLGIAEPRGGRRGPGNAIANTGVAAWAALVAIGMREPELARLAIVASLATSASDTVASELGKVWGRTTWLVIGWKRAPPGVSGGVSLEGTTGGIVSAALLAGIGAALGLVPGAAVFAIVLAATISSLVEGVLAARLEGPGILDNHALNFINSALGAALALAIWKFGQSS